MAASPSPMKYYLYKLIPPRPDFAHTMTEDEAKVMHTHVMYWSSILEEGLAVAFGPVADPGGSYGMGIIQLPDDMDPAALANGDPAIKMDMGFTSEIHPMPMLMQRG